MIRSIQIETVLGGFIVRVGCQTVVFRTRGEMIDHLNAYLQEPERVEATFLKTAENARFFPVAGPATANQGGDSAPQEYTPIRRDQTEGIGVVATRTSRY